MYNRAAPLNALALQLANSLPESESLLCWASIIWQCLHASIPCPCREHELFPYLTEPWHWRAQERFGCRSSCQMQMHSFSVLGNQDEWQGKFCICQVRLQVTCSAHFEHVLHEPSLSIKPCFQNNNTVFLSPACCIVQCITIGDHLDAFTNCAQSHIAVLKRTRYMGICMSCNTTIRHTGNSFVAACMPDAPGNDRDA